MTSRLVYSDDRHESPRTVVGVYDEPTRPQQPDEVSVMAGNLQRASNILAGTEFIQAFNTCLKAFEQAKQARTDYLASIEEKRYELKDLQRKFNSLSSRQRKDAERRITTLQNELNPSAVNADLSDLSAEIQRSIKPVGELLRKHFEQRQSASARERQEIAGRAQKRLAEQQADELKLRRLQAEIQDLNSLRQFANSF